MPLQIAARGLKPAQRPARQVARVAGRKRPLVRLADRIFGAVLAIRREKMDVILAAIGPRLGLDASVLPVVSFDPDDLEDDDNDPKYEIQDGIAVIPIQGTLVKRATGMDARSGLTSYESLTQQIRSAIEDPNVTGILFDTDSPGGESDGMLELSDLIYSLRGAKPMLAVANGQMCSAAYCIASAADQVLVTRTAMVGSVGCFMLHVDQSSADKQAGLKYTYIRAGDKKTEGNPHEPLSPSVHSEMGSEVKRIRDLFAATVARNRNVSAKSVLDTEAGVLFGPAAIPLFADRVGTSDEALAMLAAASPAATAISVPAAIPAGSKQPRLITGPTDTAAWLSAYSNIAAHSGMNGIVERLRGEHSAMSARYGASVEARIIQHPTARATAGASDRKVSLLVVPYGTVSIPIGGIREVYGPGCFREGLNNDPRCLFAHDEQKVIGRQSAGTARFWEERDGVHVEATGPDAVWFADLLQSMRRGDITQASAAFWILEAHFDTRRGERVRVVDRALMRDSSVVAFAAYQDTTATAAPAASEIAAARARLRSLDSRLTETERGAARLESLKLRS